MLGQVLPAEAFGFLLIMMRLSALVMVMPVLGETAIPRRIRVSFAFILSLLVYFSERETLPPMPQDLFGLISLMSREMLIGLLIGLMTRFLLSATHTAGTLIAFQTGLAAAQSFDPAQGSQSALVATFMTLLAVTLIVVTNLHHLLIMGLVGSYQKFPVGMDIPYADFASVAVHYVASSFLLGVHLATPFIIYGIVFNVGLGLIARMVPAFQVFFIGMPVNLFLGFALLGLLLSSMMALFLEQFTELLMDFLG